jgi:hypothetical protein
MPYSLADMHPVPRGLISSVHEPAASLGAVGGKGSAVMAIGSGLGAGSLPRTSGWTGVETDVAPVAAELRPATIAPTIEIHDFRREAYGKCAVAIPFTESAVRFRKIPEQFSNEIT